MIGAAGRMQVTEETGGEGEGRVNVDKMTCAHGQAASRGEVNLVTLWCGVSFS